MEGSGSPLTIIIGGRRCSNTVHLLQVYLTIHEALHDQFMSCTTSYTSALQVRLQRHARAGDILAYSVPGHTTDVIS